MTVFSKKMPVLNKLIANKDGNFGILTAILIPVAIGTAGVALEMTNAMQTKAGLQSAVDAATLAAATAFMHENENLSPDQASKQALEFIADEATKRLSPDATDEQKKKQKEELMKSSSVTAKVDDSVSGKKFQITANMSYDMKLNPLISLISSKTVTIGVTSTAVSSINKGSPLSMYLVLDRSGSMSFKTDTIDTSKSSCANYTESNWGQSESKVTSSPCYINKSASLKTAVSYLVDTLNKADYSYVKNGSPESKLVRTGAIGYSDTTYSAQAMNWGTTKANDYVKAIPAYPTGGTNAYTALNNAYTALRKSTATEAAAHKANGSNSFERYIVFMTDGEMSSTTIDTNVRTMCQTIKNDGIKIFSVAFMAPTKGKSLLQTCASSAENYYAPENMEEIVEAFGEIARKMNDETSRLTN